MNCHKCQYFSNGVISQSCPLNGKVAPSYKGGCDAVETKRQVEQKEKARIARLPDLPICDDAKEERTLQRLCNHELSRRGIEYLHLSHRAREKPGWPDLIFAVNNRFCAVELKSAVGRLSDEQKAVLDRLEAQGWDVAVLRSYEQFRAFLDIETMEEWEGQA